MLDHWTIADSLDRRCWIFWAQQNHPASTQSYDPCYILSSMQEKCVVARAARVTSSCEHKKCIKPGCKSIYMSSQELFIACRCRRQDAGIQTCSKCFEGMNLMNLLILIGAATCKMASPSVRGMPTKTQGCRGCRMEWQLKRFNVP